MPQQDINRTFYGQQYRKENTLPNDINSVEFRNETPTNLSTNPKRIWINQPEESAYFTVDGVNIIELARKGLLPFINVKDHPYNAKGNNTTDDTTSLQSALNVARDAGSAIIYIPDGTYIYSAYLRLYKNTTIYMSPKAILKRTGSVNKCFINGEEGNATYAFGYNGEGNIHIYGGTIDLNSPVGLSSTQNTSAYDLGHGDNISVQWQTITNGQNGHYFQLSSCRNIRIYDNNFLNQFHLNTGSVNFEVIQIEVATLESFPTFGGYDLTPSRDIFVERNRFNNTIRGIGNHGDGKYGTANIIFADNVHVIGNYFDTATDTPLTMTAFRYSHFSRNECVTIGGSGMETLNSFYNEVFDNTYSTVQGAGVFVNDSNRNNFTDNKYIDVGLSTISPFAAIRIDSSNNNVFMNETVDSAAPHYTYAYLSSGGCIGNKIISHNFTTGTTSKISGSDSTEVANIIIGGGQDVLFTGDLTTAAQTGSLAFDIRNYSQLIVMGNDNASTNAQVTTFVIPKQLIVIGAATSRYRLSLDDATDKVEFSFPSSFSIRVDVVTGTIHIRSVIGIV